MTNKTYKQQIFEIAKSEYKKLGRPLTRSEICKIYDKVRSKNRYNRTTHCYTTGNGNLTEALCNGTYQKGFLLKGKYALTKIARNQYIAE